MNRATFSQGVTRVAARGLGLPGAVRHGSSGTGNMRLHRNTSHALATLGHRAVVGVRGADALTFLQGLTTNDVRRLQRVHDAQFTSLLNGKGRTLFEVLVSRSEDSGGAAAATAASPVPFLLLDVEASMADELLGHLGRHTLRSKVELLDLRGSHESVAALPTDPFSLSPGGRSGEEDTPRLLNLLRHTVRDPPGHSSVFVDPRAPRLGLRAVVPKVLSLNGIGLPSTGALDYHALRLLLGVPEGREVAEVMPLEWNLTFLNGVSFDKGCYLGQELVARTHFRGLVRKRFVPVYFSPGGAPPRPVACADPIASAMVTRTDPALARRLGEAGGHGGGRGHGPAQTHDFPAHAAAGHTQHHARYGDGGVAPPSASASHSHLRLNFPFLDRAWRGAVELGAPIVGDAPEEKNMRLGKLVGWVPGLNLGLAQLRLEHLAHTLPAAPRLGAASEGEPEGGQEEGGLGEGHHHHKHEDQEQQHPGKHGESQRRVAVPQRLAGLKGEPGVGGSEGAPPSWEDREREEASDEDAVEAYHRLHVRCASRNVSFLTASAALEAHGGVDGARHLKGQHNQGHAHYRVTPVLPVWWRQIAHAGVEEVATVVAPG